MNKMKRIFASFLVIITLTGSSSLLTGCGTLQDPITVTDYKLNTYGSISSYTNVKQSVLHEVLNLCDDYEKMFSRTAKDSLLYQVNHQQINEIPAELAELIQYGIDYSRLSDGAFDLTIGSVSQLWDFTGEHPQVPDAQAIAQALTYVDYTKVKLTPIDSDAGTYRIDLPDHTVIDLGAIAKGYIADRLKDALLERGVTSAIINLGGNVLCVGSKQKSTDFNIGVKKPFTETNETLAMLKLNDVSAVSSGVYERYFYQDNQFYHHILDPSTGYPYNNGLTEVTIISKESVTGDCLSTTCFVLGLDKGMELIETLDDIEAIFVTSDGNIHYTSGIQKYLVK